MFAALMAVPVALIGQEKSPAQTAPPANPITASEKGFYSFVSNAVIGAAEKMPEGEYGFRPDPAVRSFGEILGHIADANYLFCSSVLGESNPSPNIEKTKITKAELTSALRGASRKQPRTVLCRRCPTPRAFATSTRHQKCRTD